jgi:hypothetical protein
MTPKRGANRKSAGSTHQDTGNVLHGPGDAIKRDLGVLLGHELCPLLLMQLICMAMFVQFTHRSNTAMIKTKGMNRGMTSSSTYVEA